MAKPVLKRITPTRQEDRKMLKKSPRFGADPKKIRTEADLKNKTTHGSRLAQTTL